MPIYEYKCKSCENEFAKLVFNQDTKIECPKCESEEVEKLISTISDRSGNSNFNIGGGSSGGCSGSGFS